MKAIPQLVDSFGRVATDLRISVTDRCNFRCRYCMPPEGMPWLPREELLTYEEIARVTKVLVDLGVRSIKLTGGEPLARRDLHVLVGKLRALSDELDISLTTNGYLLDAAAAPLAEAGLDRVTVSCDSLITHRFAEMTLRDALAQVFAGIEAAADARLTPIKINAVVMRDFNEDEVVAFARLARSTGYEIRFIEYMPLDAQDEWSAGKVVPSAEILAQISDVYPLVPEERTGADPASSYVFADGTQGKVGVIAPVSEPFCETCDRLRLTADGQLRSCLFSLEETDLRSDLRAGCSDKVIAALAQECIAAKWAGHRIGKEDFVKPTRSMSAIGG